MDGSMSFWAFCLGTIQGLLRGRDTVIPFSNQTLGHFNRKVVRGQKRKKFCQLRIKSAPFFMDLKFKSALMILGLFSYP